MDHVKQFYINGQWVAPHTTDTLAVINPATEQPIESIAMGGADDVDDAVAAAKAAFETFSLTSKAGCGAPRGSRTRTNIPGLSSRLPTVLPGFSKTPRRVMVPVDGLTTLLPKLMKPLWG